jgi:hypothetical protein
LKLHRIAAANDRLRVFQPRVPAPPGNLDMSTAPELAMRTTIAATDPTRAAAPRIKLLPQEFSIDQPGPEFADRSWRTRSGSSIARRWMALSGNWSGPA